MTSKKESLAAGLRRRAILLLAIGALAVGAMSCGDDDKEGAGSSAAKAASRGDTSAETSGSPQDQIRATYAAFIDAAFAKDGAAACQRMSKRLRGAYKKELGVPCEKEIVTTFNLPRQRGKKPSIVSVKVLGTKARARVRPEPGASITGVTFQKEAGGWKVSGSVVAE